MAQPVTTETKAEAGREEPAFPPFNTATFPSQLFWFAIVFILLYLLMSRVALPRVGGIFEFRKTRIARDLDQASAMQRQADEAAAAYEKTLAEARARAQGVAQETRDKLAAESEARRKELDASLNAKLAAAEAQIEAMRTSALANVDTIASEAAAAIIQQITGKTANAEAVAQAVAALKAG
ncbi:MAG: F0F1 ATP synthase subunit B [Methylobacteriaceae bacterium]|nr:F0F1 ATP synthase subunit B [Methylobacteriaceae bacterium]